MTAPIAKKSLEDENVNVEKIKQKQDRIKKEIARLKRLFSKIDEKKKKLVETTIADVAFMTVTMQDLREDIIVKGPVSVYQNGENQWGEKQSPEAQLYLQMSQKQATCMKILIDCLPKEAKAAVKDDGFEAFVNGRDD